MSDVWAIGFGWMAFACGLLGGAALMAFFVIGDVSAATFGAVLACIPAWGMRQMWKERPDDR